MARHHELTHLQALQLRYRRDTCPRAAFYRAMDAMADGRQRLALTRRAIRGMIASQVDDTEHLQRLQAHQSEDRRNLDHWHRVARVSLELTYKGERWLLSDRDRETTYRDLVLAGYRVA